MLHKDISHNNFHIEKFLTLALEHVCFWVFFYQQPLKVYILHQISPTWQEFGWLNMSDPKMVSTTNDEERKFVGIRLQMEVEFKGNVPPPPFRL